MIPRHRIRLAAVLFALVLAAGCGRSDDSKKAATQVAAKVNSDEITVHQINNALARTPNVAPERADQTKREILDKLVDQQLVKQKAIEKKLDRSPNVVQAIEAAKSEILARAYLDQVASALPRPTPEQTKKYYAEHPELFAQRKVFNLEELGFVAKDEVAAGLREQAAKAKSLQELATWLQSKGVKFVANRGVRAAEQIPFELLPRVQNAKDGDIILIEAGDSRQVIRVAASKSEPVDEAAASPRIQQFLFNQRASLAIGNEMKQLKEQAKIEYLGEFAGGAAAAEAKAKQEAAAKVRAQAEAKAKDKAEANQRAEALAKTRAAEDAKNKAEADARADAIAKARAAETKARLEADAKAKTTAKPVQLPQQSIEKGVSGLK